MGLKSCFFAAPVICSVLLAGRSVVARDDGRIDVWLDVDTATGVGDVDDGLMLIQCFHSPELNIRGVSVVFGNTELDRAVPIARNILSRFGPERLVPHPGAASADELGQATAAVRALAEELRRRPMTILAVGPLTNVGSLLKLHPGLHQRIERIVMVAARRPGQRFVSSEKQLLPHRDFNFELDPAAVQVVLDSSIPLVFAPWEISSKVWISRDDLEALRETDGSGAWIAETSQYWIRRWERNISPRGFNPFDTLAAGWVTHPQLIESTRVAVRIEEGPDDRVGTVRRNAGKTKPYLVVEPYEGRGRQAVYCHTPQPGFKALLMERLSGRD